MEGMKISKIAKILQVHKSTVYRWINEFQREGEKCLFHKERKGRKKEGKREGNKGRRTTRKNHMGSKNIEEKFNVKIGATGYSCVRKYVSRRLKVFIKTHLEP